MDVKVKFEPKEAKSRIISYKGTDFTIVPFLTTVQIVSLINSYIDTYFSNPIESLVSSSPHCYLEAEYNLKSNILQLVKNLEIDENDSDIYSDAVFWNEITNNISNYGYFITLLDNSLNEIKEQIILENSIGKVVSDFAVRIHELLDKIGSITPEEIEKAKEAGLKLIEELKESSLETQPVKKPRKIVTK